MTLYKRDSNIDIYLEKKQRKKTHQRTNLIIKTVVFYYMFKFGVLLIKLSYSISLLVFLIGFFVGCLKPLFFLYIPISVFILGSMLAMVGGYYSLDNGINVLDNFNILNKKE